MTLQQKVNDHMVSCRGLDQSHVTILPLSNDAIPQLFASQKAVYVFFGIINTTC